MSKEDQIALFEHKEIWEEEWEDMPEYQQKNLEPYRTIFVHFKTQADVDEFSKLIDQKLTNETKSIWHPNPIKGLNSGKRYIDEENEE